MKAYKVNVNGNVYEITLEIIDKEEIKNTPVQNNEAPVAPAAPAGSAGATQVSAPMPGTILKINVQNGQSVKKGDILMILEAMKMENEIMAPSDGTVSSVNVQTGASVETGTLLCTLA